MISGSFDRELRLWNMSKYQCVTLIQGIHCTDINSLYQIDDNRVIVGGHNTIYIVNINQFVVEKTIEDSSLGDILSFLKLRDNKTILCGSSSITFAIYDMTTGKYKINNMRNISTL